MLFSGSFSLKVRLGISLAFLLLSLVLMGLGLDDPLALWLSGLGPLAPLIAGAFYTLGLTTPMAMALILDMMGAGDAIYTMLSACAIASLVDCLLFSVMRDALESSTHALKEHLHSRYGGYSLAFPAVGFLVFGLPLPDELAMALMSFTRIDIPRLFLVILLSKLFVVSFIYLALG
jgi:hypothetical protein